MTIAIASVALGLMLFLSGLVGNIPHDVSSKSNDENLTIKSPFSFHHGQGLIVAEAASVPVRALSYVLSTDRDGDAAAGPLVMKVEMENVDPDGHCEYCIRIDYNPSVIGVGGVAWETAQPVDVQGAKRLLVAAKGQFGGEQVRFLTLGKQVGVSSSLTDEKLFENIEFLSKTGTITLTSDWVRYQIDIPTDDPTALRDVTHMIGVEIDGGNGVRPVTIFLKGFIFDDKPAADPVPEEVQEPVT